MDTTPEVDIDLTLCVPCFNEETRVTGTLETIREAMAEFDYLYEVIVIDDGSTDYTVRVVQEFIESNPGMHIILHQNPHNLGLSRTYVDASFMGRGRYFRLVWGDDVEPKETMMAIFSKMGDADLVIPYYPHVPGKSSTRMGISRIYTFLVNVLSGYELHYYNGSVLCHRHDVMRWAPRNAGFTGFLADMITHLLDEGASYVEVAVAGRHMEKDKSHTPLRMKNIASTGHTLLQIFLRRLRNSVFDSPRHRQRGHR
jgi:glycosyltransferase involved in cell wall biosynthesis